MTAWGKGSLAPRLQMLGKRLVTHKRRGVIVRICANILRVLIGVVVVSACSRIHGTSQSPTATSVANVPVADANLCGVTTTDRVFDIFNTRIIGYAYRTGVVSSKDGKSRENKYKCLLVADRDPYGSIDTVFSSQGEVSEFIELGARINYDEVKSRFPGASPLLLSGHQGAGLEWLENNGYYIAWKYKGGQVLFARIKVHSGYPTEKQKESLRKYVSEIVEVVPAAAAREPFTNVRVGVGV